MVRKMMEIQKFLKWWWTHQLGEIDRSALKIVGAGLSFLIALAVIGFLFGPAIVLKVFFSCIFFTVIGSVVYVIIGQWKQYIRHKEHEAQQIIDRLTNGANISEVNMASAQRMLAAIRARRSSKTNP
jgi:hypothetical protein